MISRKKSKKLQKGFTLIETIIYVAIIGAVVGSFVMFSLSISEIINKNNVVNEVQANMRVAIDLITQKIRLAQDVITPTEGNSSGSIELDMPDPDPNLILIVNNNVLELTEVGLDTYRVTSDEVKVINLNFVNLAGAGERDSILIDLTIEYNNPSGDREFDYSQTLETAAGLRQ